MSFKHKVFPLLLFFITLSFAQGNNSGFYDKDDFQYFLTLKADYGQYDDVFVNDLNDFLFERGWGYAVVDDSTGEFIDIAEDLTITSTENYARFISDVMRGQVEAGVQYFQFVTWLNVNIAMSQVSNPREGLVLNNRNRPIDEVAYSSMGFDWAFGWMLLSPDSRFNVIPSVGFGFNMLNVNFAGRYHVYNEEPADEQMTYYTLEDRDYSVLGGSMQAEMELRLNLAKGISVGGYGGYRGVWYNNFEVEDSGETSYFLYSSALEAFQWYGGAKVTFTMSSTRERESQ
jgi:hypothetical protein